MHFIYAFHKRLLTLYQTERRTLMYCTRSITDDIVWVGASDRRLALFENLFPFREAFPTTLI